MKARKFTFCNLTTIISIVSIIYIVISLYIDYDSFDKEDYLVKILLLAILFILVSIGFVISKSNKNRYIEEQVKRRTEDIKSENETLKIYSHIDPLTQCLNEKFFMSRFEEEFKRAIREDRYISLFIVNIDEFKSFNDIYGIEEGNECLKIIANILVNHCNRPSDLIARFEGDEFYILLPNTRDPFTVSNKCIKSVKSLNIPHDNSIASNVLTISIGASTVCPENMQQMNDLIENAKKSLKEAKKSGRNRVI